MFLSFFFSSYNSATKEESTIDSDYIVLSGSVESEKEITSYDDTILVLVIIFYIFGWYFYIYC